MWFKIRGNGSQLRVSTCSTFSTLDTYITLYSGSCGRGTWALDCKLWNDDDQSCNANSKASSIEWPSEEQDYFVFVQVHDFFNPGEFEVFVETVADQAIDSSPPDETQPGILQPETVVAMSDTCANATKVDLAISRTYQGSTMGASVDTVHICPFRNAPDSPGVWFQVLGSGNGLRVSTCHSGSAFSSTFRVFESVSNDCDDLQCMKTTSNAELFLPNRGCDLTADYTRTSVFATKAGYFYYVHLYGWDPHQLGNYEVSFTEISLPANDLCVNAENLNDHKDMVVAGSTSFATPDEETLLCEDYQNQRDFILDMPGIWYTLSTQESLKAFHASTCNSMTDFDTKLSVFSGNSCSQLSCVGFNDDYAGCGSRSAISWKATPGEKYYVEVHGYFATRQTGSFELNITEFALVENDECMDAILLFPSPGNITIGSTSNALVDREAPFCILPIDTPGVWYKLSGTGASMRASTCTEETNFDTRIAIYAGDGCESLKCVSANSDSTTPCDFSDDSSTVEWKTSPGQAYHILVYGAYRASGAFGLMLEEVDVPFN